MKRLKVAIIGQGRSGFDIHAHLMMLMPGQFKVVAIADPLDGNRERGQKAIGCDACTNHKDLFKRDDIDFIINATPSHLHVPVTHEILDAGFNVVCEKPAAKAASEIDGLIAKQQKTGKMLAFFQQARFAPYFRQVKKVIDSGVLGRVVMVKVAFNGFGRRWDWQTLREKNGGNLLNTGPHPLDQALQLLGTDITAQVFCTMDRVNTFGDAEDHVKLILTAPDRPMVDIEISSCCAYPSFTYQIYAQRGGLTGNMTQLEWKYYIPDELPEQHLLRDSVALMGYCSEPIKWHTCKWTVPASQSDMFDYMGKKYYANIYNHLTKGQPLEVKVDEIRQQIAVIEEAHRQTGI